MQPVIFVYVQRGSGIIGADNREPSASGPAAGAG
jgi:hypothetical protein